jgi:hypothetical protein
MRIVFDLATIETFELPTPEAGAVFCGPEHPAA